MNCDLVIVIGVEKENAMIGTEILGNGTVKMLHSDYCPKVMVTR